MASAMLNALAKYLAKKGGNLIQLCNQNQVICIERLTADLCALTHYCAAHSKQKYVANV